MASLVVLIMTLIHISFVNKKPVTIKQSAMFIGRNVGLTSLKHEKNSPTYIPGVSPNSVTFASLPPFTNQIQLASSSAAIKHDMDRGSYINYQTC